MKNIKMIGLAAAMTLAAGFPVAVLGQDDPMDLTVVPTDGPQDLPGRQQGPRTNDPAQQMPSAGKPEVPPVTPPAEKDREWFGFKPFLEWEHLTGDWNGSRTKMEEAGVSFAASLEVHFGGVPIGGVRNEVSARYMVDGSVTLDMEKIASIEGAKFYVDSYFTRIDGGSRDVGDIQGISNIDSGDDRGEIAEVWWEQSFFDKKLRVKLGKIDAGTEFFFPAISSYNLHASAALPPVAAATAGFPDPAFGMVVFAYPTDNYYIGGGVFDGATHDGYATGERGPRTFFSDSKSASWITCGETGVTWKELWGMGKGRVAIGANYHSGWFDAFGGGQKTGSLSLYALIEQQVWQWGKSEEERDRGVYAFLQYGHGDADVNNIENHIGAGVTCVGCLESRPQDVMGVYCSFVDLSDAVGSPFVKDETALELFYQVQATPAVTVTPALTWVWNPGGMGNIDDALAWQVRVTIAF